MCECLNDLQHRALEAYPLNAEVHSFFNNSDSKKLAQAKQVLHSQQVGVPGTYSIFYVFTSICVNKKDMDTITG
jgi:hypothetical protein